MVSDTRRTNSSVVRMIVGVACDLIEFELFPLVFFPKIVADVRVHRVPPHTRAAEK